MIDIPDGCYEELNNGQFPVQDAYRLVAWIKDGTPLPKGHGRLIDIGKYEKEYFNVGIQYDDGNHTYFNNMIPTIIEADNGESER